MASVREHYERHLAPVYLWMAGGIDRALAVGAADVEPFLDRPGLAVDLGAGFGMHAIPLARAGFEVLAVDSSPAMLADLRRHAAGLAIEAVEADLLRFAAHLRGSADLVLCMGDTLTHLARVQQVDRLMREVAQSLGPAGRFVATFRDYAPMPTGELHVVQVRGDADRILACGLQAGRTRVRVHDILHERHGDGWSTSVSRYEKLRLSPARAAQAAERAGLHCSIEPGPRGMVRLVAAQGAMS